MVRDASRGFYCTSGHPGGTFFFEELAEAVRAALDHSQGELDGVQMRSCTLANSIDVKDIEPVAQVQGGGGAVGVGAYEDARLHLHQPSREARSHAAKAAALGLGEAQEEGRAEGEQG